MTALPPQTGDLFVHGRDRYDCKCYLAVNMGFSHLPMGTVSTVHELRSNCVDHIRVRAFANLVSVTDVRDVMAHPPMNHVWCIALRCKPPVSEV